MSKNFISGMVIFVVILLCFTSCRTNWMPEDSVWYCDELQMQLSFISGVESFCIIDGEKIPCICENDTSSMWFCVFSQATNMENLPAGTELFCAERVSLTETSFVVREIKTKKEYTFIKLMDGQP